MTITERLFSLRAIPGFKQLRDEELLAIAANLSERRYRPGEIVLPADASMRHLLVVVEGGIRRHPTNVAGPAVIGADLLMTNRASTVTLVADPNRGALCLRLSKGHFFTVVQECPAFLVELSTLYAGARDAENDS